MWYYEKRLEYPVKISTPNAKIAQIILSQYGGPYCGNLKVVDFPAFRTSFSALYLLLSSKLWHLSPAKTGEIF